tara:strand:- start:3129 stop:3536 length:408 start_codon:yes stop_codon:yes gene_type:complete
MKPAVIADADVKALFDAYPAPLRKRLMALRGIIFRTATETEGVGEIVETLKWGQPSYLTMKPKSGTTIRIDAHGDGCAIFVNCKTTLVDTYRELYGDVLKFEGTRAVVFSVKDELPADVVQHCVALALTYHKRKK